MQGMKRTGGGWGELGGKGRIPFYFKKIYKGEEGDDTFATSKSK